MVFRVIAMRCYGGIVAVIFIVVLGGFRTVRAVQPDQILDGFDRTIGAARTWSMRVRITITTAASTQMDRKPVNLEATYVRDGDRRDITSVSSERPGETRAIVNGYCLYYFKSPTRIQNCQFALDGKKYVRMAIESTIPYEGALEGRFVEPAGETDVLRHSTAGDTRLLDAREPVDGAQCAVVTGSSKYGTVTLWCDPTLGFLARKIVIVKTAHDLVGHNKVGDLRLRAPGSGKLMAPERLTYTADSMKFEKLESVTMPASCRVTERYDFPSGIWYMREMTIVRDQVELHPDLNRPMLFQPDLPNGTKLSNQEDHQIPYEWHDGKPIPLVNADTVRHMDATADSVRALRNGH